MENSDEIEVCQNVEPHEVEETVKSKAVVKFSQVQVPAKFNRLECNTNLNLPPSNWLTSADNSYGLHQALYHSPGFASFRMAHMFPDCVGEVDVVADAENIKKLLKLPYTTKGAISMIVHKVGNTLLLDEFDIQKYLLRKEDDDWKWLRTFILEQILAYEEGVHTVCLKDKSREAIQTKNLLSKFLYYSLKQSDSDETDDEDANASVYCEDENLSITAPVLPEPKIEENMPDPASSHVFQRNVVWTFEDIRMLIGTDMPIFGGPNRPCISLRLRDMAKPINVLTGIDYWLDNLMCNVPEVVMCYHLDGIVQKYEIIKTEDLPYLENSQFSPQVIRNVAQNILAFLKANATKEGHTYWLFKGRNDDVVKLYDLTTLCKNQTNNECDEKHGNPFTVPVGMLLYTVARNMKKRCTQISSKTAGNIRALLDNCIKLLPKEKYPQIVTSSHYILSDLHIPVGTDPNSPQFEVNEPDSDLQSMFDEEDDDDYNSTDENEEYFSFQELGVEHNVAVKNICETLKEFHFEKLPKSGKHRPAPLVTDTEERCIMALKHVSQGLSCLQFFDSSEEKFIKESETRAKDEEKQRILHEEQNPNMAKPFKPIPLPYESISTQQMKMSASSNEDTDQEEEVQAISYGRKKLKSKKANTKEIKPCHKPPLLIKQLQDPKQVAENFNSQHFGSWNVHLKLLLFEKACLAYATFAEFNYLDQKFGASLKAIYTSCRCQEVILKYMSSRVSQKSCLLGRAGDYFFQMAKNWNNIDEYLRQYYDVLDIEENILEELEKEAEDGDDSDELIKPQRNLEHLMVSSCSCYERALKYIEDSHYSMNSEETSHELLRRLGNVRNELGLKYMYWAQEEYAKVNAENHNDVDDHEIVDSSPAKVKMDSADSMYIKLAMKSYDCLMRGINAFNLVHDNVNLAFLYCNMGRFMRFRAHLFLSNESISFVQQQKTFYNEAFAYYEKAHDVLGSRKSNPELWDLVNWEMSTATFTLAKQMQDFSTADEAMIADLEKEVLNLLQKSLKFCDVDHPGTRQVLYTYRSGLIHKRIASFHYSQLRNNFAETGTLSKTTLQLCRYHYEKAAHTLNALRETSDYLVVQLERISLQEFLAENSSHASQKIKHFQMALETCLESKSIFDYALINLNTASDGAQSINSTETEFVKHMLLFENRLQFILKTLIKLLLTGKDPKYKAEVYKKMYMETLTVTDGQKDTDCPEMLAQKFVLLLEKLLNIDRSCAINNNGNNTVVKRLA
uniref:Erythroid differentiation-related factor 1 n=1 Tax=Glossina austeni TaxID=7395 RepID=A0A1A9URR3_GLOAU